MNTDRFNQQINQSINQLINQICNTIGNESELTQNYNLNSNIDIIYWSVRSLSRSGVDRVKGVDGGIFILASYKFYLNRVHDNLM